MIEFIQDYVTKALPPESFEDGDRVERSTESELYFVRLGVAGYVVDDKLVDQDYQPIVRKTVVAVVTTDRRFADTGRGGEVIGLDAPQRASTGPGNEVVFAGQPDSLALGGVEVQQLRSDLAAAIEQNEDHQVSAAAQIEQLTADLTTVQGEREAALADAAKAKEALAQVGTERDDAVRDLSNARADVEGLRQAAEADRGRIAELEQQLVDARKPAGRAK